MYAILNFIVLIVKVMNVIIS